MKSNTNEYEDDTSSSQRIWVEIDLHKRTCHTIDLLLAAVDEKGRDSTGAAAHHLVGAMLEVRHPDLEIEDQGYTAADQQRGRAGGFMVNDTAIHVTASPTEALLVKCQANIEQGYRPMILTVENRIGTARSLADNIGIVDCVTVRGVEEFLARNIDAKASYSRAETLQVFRQLFDTYNSRVAAVEPDPSLLVEVPENLTQT